MEHEEADPGVRVVVGFRRGGVVTQGEGSSGPEVGGQVGGPAAKRKPFVRGAIIGGTVLGAVGLGLLVGGGSSDESSLGASSTTETTATTSTDAVVDGDPTEPVLGRYWKLEAVHTAGYRGEEEFTQALFIILEFDDSHTLTELEPRYMVSSPGLVHRFGTNMIDSAQCVHSAPEGDVAALASDFGNEEGEGFLEFDLTGEESTYRAYFRTFGPEWQTSQKCPDNDTASINDRATNVVWVDQWKHTSFARDFGEVIEGKSDIGSTDGFVTQNWTLIPCGTVKELCEDRT